jgi:hypothetical protein
MSIVSSIQSVINKMSVASAIDFAIGEREFSNLFSALKEYQIWIDAPLQSNGTINSGSLRRNYQVKMLFVKKQNFGNDYQQHYDNAIDVMRTLSKEFILRVNNEKDLITGANVFNTVTSVRETDIINLFDQNLSGILVEFDLRLIDEGSICTPNLLPPPTIYLFADFTNVLPNTTIRLGWIAFNVNTIDIDNGVGQVSSIGYKDVLITSEITFTGTATNENGTASSSITIKINTDCLDATAILKDEDGNTLSTTNIQSGNTQDIEAPNADYLVEYINGTPIQSGEVLSGGSVVVQVPNPIVCQDATAVVKNTLGTIIATESIPSGATEDIIITDSTAVIKNSTGTTLISEQIPAEVSENIFLADTTYQINVNGTPIAPFDLPSLETSTINITWTY